MLEYAEIQSDFLVASGISGFVFKKDSPSCGLERVKVYRGDNPQAVRDGAGLFAKVFTTLYPHSSNRRRAANRRTAGGTLPSKSTLFP